MFIESNTGLVKTHPMDSYEETGDPSQPPFTSLTQFSANSTEFSTITPMVWLEKIKHAFWITSPSPSATRIENLTGKHYLAKWAPTYPARIEFADFEGMDAWTAIGYLAEMANCRYGFNPDGTFFFKSRPRHRKSSYTLTTVGANKIAAIAKERGQKEIVNTASRVPSRSVVGDIKAHIEITSASEYGKDPDDSTTTIRHGVEVNQQDLVRKSIVLTCIQGGAVAEKTDTDAQKRKKAKFKFKVTEPKIETILRSAYSAGSYILNTENADGVRLGSAVTVSDSVNTSIGTVGLKVAFGTATTDVMETHGLADVGTNTEGQAFNSGDATFPIDASQNYIEVRKHNTNTPHTDGGIDLTQDVQYLGRGLKFGDVIAVGDLTRQGADTRLEYMTIQSIDATSDRIYVVRNSQFDEGPIKHRHDEDIYLIRNGSEIYLNAALDDSQTYSLGDEVKIDSPINDKDSMLFPTNIFDDSFVFSDRYDVAEFQPIRDEFTPIGGNNTPYATKVDLRLSMENTTNNDKCKFSEGDQIRIECQGLILDQDTASTQSATASLSVSKWGKRESQLNDNPFANALRAQWTAMREVRDSKDPRYTFKVSTLLAPWINIMDVITLQDEEVLPQSKQFSEICYVTSISFNPQTNGLMDVTLRAIDSY
tara:strand:+ start:237 stop:2189 length:1953 start_codon:yes stop_codon:yes gene_type:complete